MPPGLKDIADRISLQFLSCTIMVCMAGAMSAQNLVPNPDFETFTSCPSNFGMGGPLATPPWINGFGTTADCFHLCASDPVVDVPTNYFGFQHAHSGFGYIGAIHKASGVVWREYPQTELLSPLEANQLYYVGAYVNLGNYTCGVQHVGIHLSVNQPPWTLPDGIVVGPQVYYTGGFLSDTLNWTVIEGYYMAQGGEQWITLGNFELDANTSFDPPCASPWVNSYYYYDDVWVIPAEPCDELVVDLGDDVVTCFEHTIDPGLEGYFFSWSTGSTEPTLTVTESGVYGLTITDSCRVGIDHIEVIILGNIPIEIGPDSVLLCQGESFNIELDGAYGEYTWQDGSDDPMYVIESPGNYSVIYDDGCAVSGDTIVVDVLDPPAPFTLGEDTLLCDDNEYFISFDQSLGEFEWSDGSDESSFNIDEEGSYALTISNVCGEESAAIEVEYGESPDVNLGHDVVFICQGDIIDFELDEDEGSYLWQDSSTSLFYEISSPGLYSVTVTNNCGSYDDELTVMLTPLPLVNLGPDIVVCPAQLPDTIDVSGAGGTSVVWMDGSTLQQFAVTTAGTYSVTVTNACGSNTDTLQVAVDDILPDVILPDDMMACVGDSIWLHSTGDPGAWLWQDGTTDDSLLVQTSGQYTLQVSTICGIGSDTVNIQLNPVSLYPDLGPDVALCPGNMVTLFAGNSFDTYLWQNMSDADSFVVSAPGMYTVTVSDACGMGVDTVLVFASGTPPQLNLMDSMYLCAASQVILDAGITGVDYLWNDGSMMATLIIDTPGIYSLTVSNNCGMDTETVVIEDGGTAPAIELGNNITLCNGESQIISPDLSNAESWLWQDGSTDFTFLVNTSSLVTIEVSNACGTVYDTLYSSLLPAIPPLHLGNDTALCSSEALLLEINIPDVSISWFDGSHSDQITIVQSGLYTAVIENACGVSTDTMIVSPLSDIPELSLGPDQLLCVGEVLTFNPGIPDVQYVWQDGTTGSSFSTTTPGQVILTISNACGTTTDSLLIVESTEGPQLDLGPDVTACKGDTVTIQSGVVGVSYTWHDGSANPFFAVSDDAELTLQIANSCGVDDDSIAVHFITPPEPNLGPDTVLCDNEVLTLTSNADLETTTTWQDGSHTSSFVAATTGAYSLQHVNVCGDITDSISVTYLMSPQPFTLGPDAVLCPGESIVLQAPLTTDQLLWQDGSDSAMILADAHQVYSLTIANACGTTYDEVLVTYDLDIPILQFDFVLICPGDVLTLDAAQPFDATYIWSTGDSNASIEIQLPGEYIVTVMTPCYTRSDVIPVELADECEPDTQYYIPNLFSPNGDQVNDVFSIQFNAGAEVLSVTVDIFDRWGNLVFSSKEHPFSWDGTFNGELLNPGVYVYQFTLEYSNGIKVVTKNVTGDVTLVR